MTTIDLILDALLAFAIVSALVSARITTQIQKAISTRKNPWPVLIYNAVAGFAGLGLWTWLAFEAHQWQFAALMGIPWLIRLGAQYGGDRR